MGDLSKLPNIGAICEKRLIRVGIKSTEDLKRIGSREAFIKLYLSEEDTCFNTLCALEGAIQGKRWHDLSDGERADLKKFYIEVTKNIKED